MFQPHIHPLLQCVYLINLFLPGTLFLFPLREAKKHLHYFEKYISLYSL